jgi:uncharacterized protein involved in exopolysaccharide biosynthesis
LPDNPPSDHASDHPADPRSSESFYLRALRRGAWLVLVVILVAVGVAWWLTSRQTPTYQASASLVVTPNTEVRDTTDLLRALETLERRTVVATFARLPSSPETTDAVAERLGIEPREVGYYWIGGAVVPNTNIVRIDVYGPDPERTAEVANATARVVRREARHLYKIYSLREIGRAEPPRRPVRPEPRRNAVVAAILGLFLGILAALGLETARSRRSA